MAICHHLAPNGEKSILYQQLEQKYGAEKANDIWLTIRTQQFLNKHGDWTSKNAKARIDLDQNNEPPLEWVEGKLQLKHNSLITFKPANQEQANAIDEIQKFIRFGVPSQYHTVAGKAGTGKTTIVQEAIAPFIEEGQSILIAALSHKAKVVLGQKLTERFGKDAVVAKSIAGALAMGMDLETGKFSPEFGSGYEVPPIAKANVIIIDEASMVNEEALALIMEMKRPDAKVIFLGDIGQLPPIREKGDINSGKPAPVFNVTDNISRLTERVRQGEESPILPYADLFWDNSQGKSPVEDPADITDRTDIINDKGALVFAKTVNSILPKVLPLYKQAIETNQPNLIKIVLYRNTPRQQVNTAIRQYVFEKEASKQFLPKELLIFSDNYRVEGLKDPISNATEIQVSSATKSVTKEGFQIWNIEFGYEGRPIVISALANESVADHKQLVSDMFSKAKAMPKGAERGKAMSAAWAESKKYAPLDYAYAITSHKSQGSTYNTVVVVENDIMGVTMIGAKEKSQSIYTAITRASTTVIIVDGSETDQNNIDQALELSKQKIIAQPTVSEFIPSTESEPVQQSEPGVYTQFGTSYRFNEDGTKGEFRQGKGEWKPMNDKSVKAKYQELVPNNGEQPESSIVLTQEEVDELAPWEEQPVVPVPATIEPISKTIALKGWQDQEKSALLQTAIVNTKGFTVFPKIGLAFKENGLTNDEIEYLLSEVKQFAEKNAFYANVAKDANVMFTPGGAMWSQKQHFRDTGIYFGSFVKEAGNTTVEQNGAYGYYLTDQFGKKLAPISNKTVAILEKAFGEKLGNILDASIGNFYFSNTMIQRHKDTTEPRNDVSIYSVVLGNPYDIEFDSEGNEDSSYKTGGDSKKITIKATQGLIYKIGIWNGKSTIGRFSGHMPHGNVQTSSPGITTIPLPIINLPAITKGRFKQAPEIRPAITHSAYAVSITFRSIKEPAQINKSQFVKDTDVNTIKTEQLQSDIKFPNQIPTIEPVQTPKYAKKIVYSIEPNEKGDRVEEDVMLAKIAEFYALAKANPTTQYEIPYEFVSNKKRTSSGYNMRELANLFDHTGEIPTNVKFKSSFLGLIQNSSRRIIEEFKRNTPVEFMARDSEAILDTIQQILVPKIGLSGQNEGWFSPKEHREVLETVMYITQANLKKNPALGPAGAMARAFAMIGAQATMNPGTVRNLAYINTVRVRIAEDVLNYMEAFGWSMKNDSKTEMLSVIRSLKPLTEEQKSLIIETGHLESLEQDADQFNEELGDFLLSAGYGTRDWNDVSFELDPKDTASARMKMYMATMPKVDNEMVPLKNFLGFKQLVDFEMTFEDALAELSNRDLKTINDILPILKESTKPDLRYLALQLEQADKQLQNEFVKVMSKQYQNFAMILFDKTEYNGKPEYALTIVNANRYSQQETLINNWKEQQKLSPMMVLNTAGERVPDFQRARDKWLKVLDLVAPKKGATGKTILFDWTDETKVAPIRKFVTSMFHAEGMSNWTQEMTDYLFRRMERVTKGTSYEGGIAKQFGVNESGTPNGIFSAFILQAAGMNAINDFTPVEDVPNTEKNNPLFHSATKIFAKVATKFIPRTHSGSHRSSEGKTVWDYGQNSKLSHMFREFLINFDNLKGLYATKGNEVDIVRRNWLLNTVAAKPELLRNMRLDYLDGLRPSWGRNRGVTRTAMSDREQLLMSLALFQNQGNATANYLSLTHADKGTTPLFMGIPKVRIADPLNAFGFKENGDARLNELIQNEKSPLYSVFHAEHQRIVNQQEKDFNNKQYNTGKNYFYFIPDFNYDNMKQMVEDGTLTLSEFQSIWLAGERILVSNLNNDKELKVINKVLTQFVLNMVNTTLAKWQEAGITTSDNSMFDKNYVKKLKRDTLSENASIRDVIRTAAQDYTINSFLFNTSLSQLFFGDPAMTFKASKVKDATDQDHVNSTMVEYAKRLAKDIAPGQDMAWDRSDMTYTTITLADVVSKETYMPVALLKAYGEVEGTDAQEFTTVREHLKVMFAQGLVPQSTYDEMVKIIDDAGPGGFYEFVVPEHKAVIMQPMKPVFSGQRKTPQDGALLEDYVKSSAYPLYPPLIEGSEINKVRIMMEQQGIDRANFASAKKMGNPNQPARLINSDGTYNTTINPNEITGAIQVLDRSGFRIQQEVPYDESKEAIKTITQANKLIVEGVGLLTGFEIPGVEGKLSGTEVRALKEGIRKQMIAQNVNKFLSSIGMSNKDLQNLQRGGKLTQEQKEKIYNILADEAKKKGYSVNEQQGILIRNEKGDPVIPLWLNPAAAKFESRLMAAIKKIAEVKMPGKSYVQASSAGYKFKNLEDIDASKLIHTGEWDGSPLKMPRIENGELKPAQIIVPFNFTDNDGNNYDVKDFLIPGTNRLDMTRVPKELLQLFAARIPNQGHNSMLPAEIVAFTPPEMGDIAIVPAGITKQMGADFDVDKLYTYKRPYYTADDGTLAMYPTDGEFEGLQTQYFNLHWGVLTHPEMLEKMLRPLDKSDLEDENKLLAPKTVKTSYYHVLSQLDNFQSGKDAKTLVGSTSLSVTFNAVIQDKNLYYSSLNENGEEVRAYINIGGLRLTNLSGYGTSMYNGEVRTKHDNLTTMQSAALDNAKTRVLDNLNLNSVTYKAAAALMMLEDENGQALDLRYVSRLLTQPIIKEFVSRMRQGNDSLTEGFTTDLKNTVMEELLTVYGGKFGLIEIHDSSIELTAESLLEMQALDPEKHPEEYMANQREVLFAFRDLDAIGTRLSELQGLINNDTNGAGPNLLYALDKADKMETIDQTPIANAADLIYHNNERTEQSAIFSATVGMANTILTQLLPYNNLKDNVFTLISSMANRDRLTNDQQRKILSGLKSYIYTKGSHWWTDAQSERTRLFYGENSLAKRILEAKRTWGKDNEFLHRLNTKIGNTTNSPDYVEYQASSSGTLNEKVNEAEWAKLMVEGNDEQRMLGEDLLRYSYLIGGQQDSNSFIKFAPIAYIANTTFSDALQNVHEWLSGTPTADELARVFSGFVTQYFQHNPDFAVQIDAKVFGQQPAGQDTPESFVIPSSESPEYHQRGLSNLRHPQFGMVPLISYRSKVSGEWNLYQKKIEGEQIWYVKIDKLGNKQSDEYDGERLSGHRSVFAENRSLAGQVPGNSALEMLQQLKNEELGNYNSNVDNFERLGIKEGTGARVIYNALDVVKDNPEINEYLRTVARILSQTRFPDELLLARTIQGVDRVGIQFVTDERFAGQYGGGTIKLSRDKATSVNHAAEILLHEVGHERLQEMVMMAGFDPRVMQDKEIPAAFKQNYQQQVALFNKRYPQISEHLSRLDAIRYQALNTLRNELGEDFDRIREEVNSKGILSDQHRLMYALMSLQEFVTHVLTSAPTQEYLNNIQSKNGKSLINRIWDTLTELFEALAKAFGIHVKDGSLLQEAFAHVLKLTTLDVSRDIQITDALRNGTTLTVGSESEAMNVVSLAEEVYNRKVEMEVTPLAYQIRITNEEKISPDSRIGKVLSKLQEQKNDAQYAINNAPGKAEQVLAKSRLADLQDDIDQLTRERNLNYITTIGKKQLDWVDNILATPGAPATDILTAIRITDMWSGINDLLRSEFAAVGADDIEMTMMEKSARDRRAKLDKRSFEVINTATGTRIKVSPSEPLQDENSAESKFRAINTAKNKLVQSIGVLGRQEANNAHEEFIRLNKQMADWDTKMKKYGIKSTDLMQENNWGLIQRVHGSWYQKLRELARVRNTFIDAANRADATGDKKKSDEARSKKINDAWKTYWTEIRKEAAFVDVRAFFDFRTGERKTDDKAAKALAGLIDDIGSEEYAKELVDKAQVKFQAYLDERQAYEDHLEGMSLTEEEKEGKSISEQEEFLKTKKSEMSEVWKNRNSPITFFNSMDDTTGKKSLNRGSVWTIMVPKSAAKIKTDYYDTRYSAMYGLNEFTGNANEKMREVYEELHAIIQKLVSYLPASEQENLDEDFLPIISKESVTSLASVLGTIRNWDTELLQMFTATEAEEYSRLKPNEIPIRFTQASYFTRDPEMRSTDMTRIIKLFGAMAIHYKYMSKVLPAIQVAENIIKEHNRQASSPGNDKKVLENATKAVEYFIDALIFKKPKELQTKVSNPVYIISKKELSELQGNPAKIQKVKNRIKDLSQRKEEIAKEIERLQVEEGVWDTTEFETELDAINVELTEYEKHAQNLYGSKAADTLISVNQFKTLGFAPFSAIGNLTFGLISAHVQSHARADYDPKSFRWALGTMMNSVLKYTTFGTVNRDEAEKISNLMETFGIMGDVRDSKQNMGDAPKRMNSAARDAISPYNWQRSGDYFAKGAVLIAMMRKQTVKVTIDGKEETIPLYDAFGKTGEWDVAKYGPAPEWFSENISDQTEKMKFRERARKVTMIVFGNQDTNAPMLAKKDWGWRMVGQFRMSWFAEGLATRFSSEREDSELGRTTKGRYLSYGTIGLVQSFMVTSKQLLSSLPFVKIDPFTGVTNREGKQISQTDMENLRKNFAELAWTMSIFIAILAMDGLFGGDDKRGRKKDAAAKARQFVMNMLVRNYQDLVLYAQPSVVDTVSGNLLPATTVITDGIKAVKATVHYLAAPGEKDAAVKMLKKQARAFPITNLWPKTEYLVTRDLMNVSK